LSNGATHAASQNGLSFVFGLIVRGFFYSRFAQLSGAVRTAMKSDTRVSAAMTGFYLSGSFAGHLFGKLVELGGWRAAANVMGVAPPCVPITLVSFFDFERVRKT